MKTYVIKIEVTYKKAPKGTGNELVKNVEKNINEIICVGDLDIEEWDVKVSKK